MNKALKVVDDEQVDQSPEVKQRKIMSNNKI